MVQFSKAYWLVIGLMIITAIVNIWLRAPKPITDQAVDLQVFPKQINGWIAEEHALDSKIERVLRTDQTLLRQYIGHDGRKAELFIGYYQDQKFGAQVHSPQHCLPGSGWTILRHERFQLPFDKKASYANKLHILKDGNNQFVVYWFSSGGFVMQNEFDLKFRLLINAFRHQATSVYFYRVCIPFAANEEKEALERLNKFANIAGPYFNH